MPFCEFSSCWLQSGIRLEDSIPGFGYFLMPFCEFSSCWLQSCIRLEDSIPNTIIGSHEPLLIWSMLQQDAGISGLNSKTHMKILLKWMTGRRIVKLNCVGTGNSKKFLYSPYSADADKSEEAAAEELSKAAASQGGKATKGQQKKRATALHWLSLITILLLRFWDYFCF